MKQCSIKMALAFGDEKVAKQLETVSLSLSLSLSLSQQIVARRAMEISEYV